MHDWKWNIFDSTIVLLHLMDVILEHALGNDSSVRMPKNVNFMRILRILRLVRIVRLVRVLRYFQELRTMVSSIIGSLKSLLWTIVLVALLIYVVGVYLSNLIIDHAALNPTILVRDDIGNYYGSLMGTMLSLFQAMTGGVDWDDLLRPLMEEISPLLAVVFSLYITFSVLCMMNVITGVFVESALMTARGDKDKDVRRQIETAFACTDSDGSGKISCEEFGEALDDPKVAECLNAIEIDPREAKGLFALLDANGSGDIDKEEFVMGCLRLRGQARAIDLATLTYFNKRVSSLWIQVVKDIETAVSQLQTMVCEPSPGSPCTPLQETTAEGQRIHSKELNLCATWSDLLAEGDRKVKQLPRVNEAKEEDKSGRKSLVGLLLAAGLPAASGTTAARSVRRRLSV
jgi:hypothetical protein